MKASTISALVLAALVLASETWAQQMPTPVDVQIPILFKVLAFDRQLTDAKDKDLVLGVLYQSGYRTAAGVKDTVVEVSTRVGADGVASRRLRLIPIDVDGKEPLETLLRQSGAQVLYVTPLRALDVAALAATARKLRILTMTGVPEYVRSGLVIGIGLKRDRPEILVNLKAGRSVGADLAAPLLKMSTIVESPEPAP